MSDRLIELMATIRAPVRRDWKEMRRAFRVRQVTLSPEIVPLGNLKFSSNGPFYNCVLSDLALDWKRGWVDLALIETSLLFICRCKLVSIRTA